MTDWKHPRNGDLPPEGVTVETVDSGGKHQDLVYDRGLWWFPDRSMYVYYVPRSWRPGASGTGTGREPEDDDD